MNQEVIISGAWKGFEQGVNEWAVGTHLNVSKKMGMVICSSDLPEDLRRLLDWLKAAVQSGLPKNVVSFESALFPPMTAGGKSTLVRGLAAEREREVLMQLPAIAATPRSMVQGVKVRA